MNWFENASYITKLVQEEASLQDQKALKASINLQGQAGPTDLVLRHRGNLMLMMLGVDKIFVPLSSSNGETQPVTFPASSLLEIQIAPTKIEAS